MWKKSLKQPSLDLSLYIQNDLVYHRRAGHLLLNGCCYFASLFFLGLVPSQVCATAGSLLFTSAWKISYYLLRTHGTTT